MQIDKHPLTRPTQGIAEANSLGQLTTFGSEDLTKLAGGHLSHDQVAVMVRMLLRSDLDHEAVCVIARDRIKWLAHRVAVLESGTSTSIAILAEFIIRNARKFEWSLQGMGMLRLYLTDNIRLHVWDSRYRRPGVSMIHDHLQWSLHSTIIAGRLTNRRYNFDPVGLTHRFAVLKPGYGCYFLEEPKLAGLIPREPEFYSPGDYYSQRPDEVHETDAVDGTVTLMVKSPTGNESARVFWPADSEWGSAEPRTATADEVREITSHSLARWFDSHE